jgi:hypothetical protein
MLGAGLAPAPFSFLTRHSGGCGAGPSPKPDFDPKRPCAAAIKVMTWLWDWLFPRRLTHYCLEAKQDAALEIRFPDPVREVRLRICSGFRPSFAARRRSRTLGEVRQAVEDANRQGVPPDLRACSMPVGASATQDGEMWTVVTAEGLECLHIENRKDGLAIREICYLSAAEAERAPRAVEEGTTNSGVSCPVPDMLKPGRYYALEMTTAVRGILNFALLDIPSGWLGTAVEEAYRLASGALDFVTTSDDPTMETTFDRHTIFFQTEGPPSDLRPYVKWSSPGHQDERVFRGNDIVLRFLRSGLREMMEEAPFGVTIEVCSAAGERAELDLAWDSARSPEDLVWEEHRSTLGWPARPTTNDDLRVAVPRKILEPKTATLSPSAAPTNSQTIRPGSCTPSASPPRPSQASRDWSSPGTAGRLRLSPSPQRRLPSRKAMSGPPWLPPAPGPRRSSSGNGRWSTTALNCCPAGAPAWRLCGWRGARRVLPTTRTCASSQAKWRLSFTISPCPIGSRSIW